jgi:hypothetical protein
VDKTHINTATVLGECYSIPTSGFPIALTGYEHINLAQGTCTFSAGSVPKGQHGFLFDPLPGIYHPTLTIPLHQGRHIQQNNTPNEYAEHGIACQYTYGSLGPSDLTAQPGFGVQFDVQDMPQDLGWPSDDYQTGHRQPQQELIQSLPEFNSQPAYGLGALSSRTLAIEIPEDDPIAMAAHHCGCCPLQQALNAEYQSGTPATTPAAEQALAPARAFIQAREAGNADIRHFCTLSGCARSFGRKADLERHIETMHSGIIYWCPQLGCDRSAGFSGVGRWAGVGFKRQDKLKEHIEKAHNM